VPVHTVTERFGVNKKSVAHWLAELGVPTICIGNQEYFNLYSLKRAIYLVTQVGAPGFLCLGSKVRRDRRNRPASKAITQITPEILAELFQLDPDYEIRKAIHDSLNTKALSRMLDKIGHTRGGREATNRTLRKIQRIAGAGPPNEVDGSGENR